MIGVADQAVEDGTALEAAITLAGRLAALPRPSVAATKRFR